jgi:regulator of protease activity HflC (stomatin/prohibitin superfamily)
MALEQFCFFIAVFFPLIITLNGFHTVPEGHVGIYFRGGALLDTITEPGYHVKLPMITSYEIV